MILWPHVLPQYLLMDGYGEAEGNAQLRSGMDAGPDKVRRRFTAVTKPLQGKILVNQAQFAFFKFWYEDVLLGGTLRFGWIEPWSGDTITNLITNGGFDSDTTGWTASDSSLASITPSPVLYGKCLELTYIASTYQLAYQAISLTTGKDYQLTGYLKSGTSGNETGDLVVVDEFDSAELGREQLTTSSLWQVISLPFTSVNTGNHTFYCEKIGSTEGTMLFDEITLYDITTKPTEFRFTEPPTYEAAGGAYIVINMSLEILP